MEIVLPLADFEGGNGSSPEKSIPKPEFGNEMKTFDIKQVLQLTKQRLSLMTPDEQKQSLVWAGILTKSGKVSKPYAKVIK